MFCLVALGWCLGFKGSAAAPAAEAAEPLKTNAPAALTAPMLTANSAAEEREAGEDGSSGALPGVETVVETPPYYAPSDEVERPTGWLYSRLENQTLVPQAWRKR